MQSQITQIIANATSASQSIAGVLNDATVVLNGISQDTLPDALADFREAARGVMGRLQQTREEASQIASALLAELASFQDSLLAPAVPPVAEPIPEPEPVALPAPALVAPVEPTAPAAISEPALVVVPAPEPEPVQETVATAALTAVESAPEPVLEPSSELLDEVPTMSTLTVAQAKQIRKADLAEMVRQHFTDVGEGATKADLIDLLKQAGVVSN